jgi:hypothetical protein
MKHQVRITEGLGSWMAIAMPELFFSDKEIESTFIRVLGRDNSSENRRVFIHEFTEMMYRPKDSFAHKYTAFFTAPRFPTDSWAQERLERLYELATGEKWVWTKPMPQPPFENV